MNRGAITSYKKYPWVVIFGCLTFGVPLVAYAINGSFMRLSGDDYCYGDLLTRLGFWKAQSASYFQPQAYNGNRFSLTFFSDLGGLLGPRINGILPGLAILVWLLGSIALLYSIARFAGFAMRWAEIILISEVLVFFNLYMAPSLPQVLYWRSGMLPYLAPLIANAFLLSLVLNQVKRPSTSKFILIFIALLAFISGGFSETATALQIGYLALLLLTALLLKRRKIIWASSAAVILTTALIASLIAFLVLAISPSNAERLLHSAHPGVVSFILITLKSTGSFMAESLFSLPLPNLVLFILSVGIGWLITSRIDRVFSLDRKKCFLAILLFFLSAIFLIACCMAPSAYAQSASPELRALITARLVMVLLVMAAGALFSLAAHQVVNPSSKLFRPISLGIWLVIGVLSLYPLYSSRNIFRTIPTYQRWAAFWDNRNQSMITGRQNNVMDLHVVKIDHIIPDVGDLSEDPGYWYNICAAGYYGVQSIHADQPGWDNP